MRSNVAASLACAEMAAAIGLRFIGVVAHRLVAIALVALFHFFLDTDAPARYRVYLDLLLLRHCSAGR